jgi:dolichol kinase
MSDVSVVFSYGAEVKRKALHLGALAIPVGILVVHRPAAVAILASIAALAVAADVARLRWRPAHDLVLLIFGPIMRPGELPPLGGPIVLNGATWMCISSALCAALFPAGIAAASLAMMMIGDAAAALVGRRWGRTRFPGTFKSLEASMAFVVAGWLAALPFGYFAEPALGPGVLLAGAAVAAAVEVLPIPLNDNIRVPLAAGLILLLLA